MSCGFLDELELLFGVGGQDEVVPAELHAAIPARVDVRSICVAEVFVANWTVGLERRQGGLVHDAPNARGGKTLQVVRLLGKPEPADMRPSAHQGSQNGEPSIEVRLVDLDLVIEAPLANDCGVQIFEPIGRCDDQQSRRLSMGVQLLEQRVDHLLLVKAGGILPLAGNRVELVEEKQAGCLRSGLVKQPLDGIRGATHVLADGTLERHAQ